MDLKDKIIVVTGATAGIGEACARDLAAAGAKLVITGRREDRLIAFAKEIGEDRCLPLVFDVRDQDAVSAAFGSLPDTYANVDGLINNAGLALGVGPADVASLDHWNTMIDTNCKGLAYCTRALLPGMRERNAGHIVNVGSIAGSYPYPGGNCYGATKAFVLQFSHNLRADLLGTAIRVTNIEPGLTETEFSIVRYEGDKSAADKVYQGAHSLVAEDISRAVVWAMQQPDHVNINRIEIMPTSQAAAGLAVHRDEG